MIEALAADARPCSIAHLLRTRSPKDSKPAKHRERSRASSPIQSHCYDDISGLDAYNPRKMSDRRPVDELVLIEVQQLTRDGQGPSTFIDLTQEPDSPPRPSFPSRPSRRPGPGMMRAAPSLQRSDSSALGGHEGLPEVIDLTDDTPERPRDPPPSPRNNRRGVHPEVMLLEARQRRMGPNNPPGGSRIPPFIRELLGAVPFAAGGRDGFFANFGNMVERHIPDLDYGHPAFNHIPPPPPPPPAPAAPRPPPFVPPPCRPGFSRDTGEETYLVCPACDNELDYDPGEAQPDATPSGKKKSRRDKGEHHFWAVKACGHVFCRDCFENRRTGSKKATSRFPMKGTPPKLTCAVEDCQSEVANKTAWVGIFL